MRDFLARLAKPYYTPIECSGWTGSAVLLMQHGAVRWLGVLAPPASTLLSAALRRAIRSRAAS